MAIDSKTREDELGALWRKTGSRGEYFTGTIQGVAVVVFPNERKTPGSNQPDWRVLKARPRPSATETPAPVTTDDIPF